MINSCADQYLGKYDLMYYFMKSDHIDNGMYIPPSLAESVTKLYFELIQSVVRVIFPRL